MVYVHAVEIIREGLVRAMSIRRVFAIGFVLMLSLVALPSAVSGQTSRQDIGAQPGPTGPSEDDQRGLGDQGQEAPASSADEGESDADDPSSYADQQILDDLIVDGSACIGLDCVNGESFGFDTIRLKENNLRIAAVDTSNTASFPSQDWQLVFNDSSNGGRNRFSVEATSPSAATPFTIEAGGNNNALYVDDGGRVGFGTNNPVVELHVVNGDSPTLRLEQSGSSGFTPQTWDLAGNETNFFIRDATNGSTLPFRVRPGAPTSSIDIANSGFVGLGTSSPDSQLEIEDNAPIEIRMTNTAGDDWKIFTRDIGNASEGLVISRDLSGEQELRITPFGALVIPHAPPPTLSAGTIYFDGDTFCGYDGTDWRPLQAAGDQTCD